MNLYFKFSHQSYGRIDDLGIGIKNSYDDIFYGWVFFQNVDKILRSDNRLTMKNSVLKESW